MKYGLSNEIYDEIKKIINKYSAYQFKIFGSRARGDYKKNSDIDIAVFGDVSEQDKFLILNEFDLINMQYTIDIVFMKNIEKQSLIDSILKEGVEF
jgi:hypothetical protein